MSHWPILTGASIVFLVLLILIEIVLIKVQRSMIGTRDRTINMLREENQRLYREIRDSVTKEVNEPSGKESI